MKDFIASLTISYIIVAIFIGSWNMFLWDQQDRIALLIISIALWLLNDQDIK